MKKIKMARGVTLTFEEGCNKYLENCRQRNLREGTINHYILNNILKVYGYEIKFQDIYSAGKYPYYILFLIYTILYTERDRIFR